MEVPQSLPPPRKAVPLGKVASPQAMTEGVPSRRAFFRLFVTNPARCGTIKGYRTHTERTFPCSCLNWSAHGCSARWRGPTGRFMQSFCCCSGRSAAIRQITAFPAPRPSPVPRIILPRWQSRTGRRWRGRRGRAAHPRPPHAGGGLFAASAPHRLAGGAARQL